MQDNSKTENILWKLNDLIEDADSEIEQAWSEAYDTINAVLDRLKEQLELAKAEKDFITEDGYSKLEDIEAEIDTIDTDVNSFSVGGNFNYLTFDIEEEMMPKYVKAEVTWKLNKYGNPEFSAIEAALKEYFLSNDVSIFDYEITEE